MMTFSLSPRRSSTLPLMAASVSTRVVSWKDAAEMKDSVDRDALVMPSGGGLDVAGAPHLASIWRSPPRTDAVSTTSPTTKSVSPTSPICTRRSICRTMTSMWWSLNRDALQPVDLLDLVDQILLELLVAEDGQDVVRVLRALHERLARLHAIALAHP